MEKDLMLLSDEDRLTRDELSELLGGTEKHRLEIKIEVCWVEEPDSTSTKPSH